MKSMSILPSAFLTALNSVGASGATIAIAVMFALKPRGVSDVLFLRAIPMPEKSFGFKRVH